MQTSITMSIFYGRIVVAVLFLLLFRGNDDVRINMVTASYVGDIRPRSYKNGERYVVFV
jgi:hypothetical protein